MAGSPWLSSSSCTSSFGSLDEEIVVVVKPDAVTAATSADRCVKFLCSYGGRILPRHSDGALRYVGGDNRVLSADRSVHFYELQRKLREMCGWDDVSLRCQLPTEDLDALVSVTGDDDLANLLDEYDAASRDRRLQPMKIRAFLFPRTTPATSPPRSTARKLSSPSSRPSPKNVQHQLHRRNYAPDAVAAGRVVSPTSAPRWWGAAPRSTRTLYLVHNGSHWQ